MSDEGNESAAAGWLVILATVAVLFGGPLVLAMLGM